MTEEEYLELEPLYEEGSSAMDVTLLIALYAQSGHSVLSMARSIAARSVSATPRTMPPP